MQYLMTYFCVIMFLFSIVFPISLHCRDGPNNVVKIFNTGEAEMD